MQNSSSFNKDCAILEIRSAAGGDEAKIWAEDLFRMYFRFAEKQNWQAQVIDSSVLKIKGSNAFETLRNEAGVHRVQRVPKTERYGRIHTSTATVAVLPQIDESQIKTRPEDLDWQFYRASSQGGQNVQKVSSAVRLIHKPTNTVVTCEQERTQEQNRQIALQLLRTKLWEKEELKKEATISGYRSSIGRGMRAEKIRTYNFAQDRITDHRIKKSFHNLENILNGNLNKILEKLNNN